MGDFERKEGKESKVEKSGEEKHEENCEENINADTYLCRLPVDVLHNIGLMIPKSFLSLLRPTCRYMKKQEIMFMLVDHVKVEMEINWLFEFLWVLVDDTLSIGDEECRELKEHFNNMMNRFNDLISSGRIEFNLPLLLSKFCRLLKNANSSDCFELFRTKLNISNLFQHNEDIIKLIKSMKSIYSIDSIDDNKKLDQSIIDLKRKNIENDIINTRRIIKSMKSMKEEKQPANILNVVIQKGIDEELFRLVALIYYNIAENYLLNLDFDNAFNAYLLSLLYYDNAYCYFAIGKIFMRTNNKVYALINYEIACSIIDRDNLNDLNDRLEQVLELEGEVHYSAASIYDEFNKHKAIEHYTRAIFYDPKIMYYQARAECYTLITKQDKESKVDVKTMYMKAMRDFEMVIELTKSTKDSVEPEIYNRIGYIYFRLGNDLEYENNERLVRFYMTKSIEYYNLALSHDDDYHYNRGVSYFEMKDYKNALRDFKIALSLIYNNIEDSDFKAEIHYKIAIIYFVLYRYEKAIKHFTRSISFNSSSIPYYNRGWIYCLCGRNEDAMKDVNYLFACNSRDAYAYYLRARILHNAKKYHEAIIDINKAIEINPLFWAGYQFRGDIFNDMGLLDDALRDYKCVLAAHFNKSTIKRKIELVSRAKSGIKSSDGFISENIMDNEIYDLCNIEL